MRKETRDPLARNYGPFAGGRKLPSGKALTRSPLDADPAEEKMKRLVAQLNAQFEESVRLEEAIRENLRDLGYGL